jgi:hypothetical protein
MRFYDREPELAALRKYDRVAVIGRRRVGKTRLVEEALGEKGLTLFVGEKKEKLVCKDWMAAIRKRGLYVPELASMRDIIEFLLEQKDGPAIFMDEFQNLVKVNSGFLSDFQRLLDGHPGTRVVITGSLMSMTKKLIEEYASPVYGRFDTVLRLRELSFRTVARICADLGRTPEEAVLLYSVFGGIPKHYETISRSKAGARDFVEEMFLNDPYPLVEQVRLMLREEFGKEYRTFFSILEAVAQSSASLGEIAAYIGERSTNITKYLSGLEREYEFLQKRTSVTGGGKHSYRISENLVDFWFRFVWRFWPFPPVGNSEALRYFRQNFNSYVGVKFEDIVRDNAPLPFEPETSGRWWGARREGDRRAVEEIDLVAFSMKERRAAFIEAKWKDLRKAEAKRIIEDTRRRSALVMWDRRDGTESFGVAARSIEGKDELREMGLLVYDLGDLISGKRK